MSNKTKIDFTQLKEKLLTRRGLIWMAVTAILLLLVFGIIQSCTPRKGSMLYALCSAFLELQVPFPETLDYTSVEQYPAAVRIYFTHTDSFGQYQFEMTECTFVQDPQKGVQLDRVFFNYVKDITESESRKNKGRLFEVKKEYIDLYNRSQSPRAIMSGDPDMDLPKYGYRF